MRKIAFLCFCLIFALSGVFASFTFSFGPHEPYFNPDTLDPYGFKGSEIKVFFSFFRRFLVRRIPYLSPYFLFKPTGLNVEQSQDPAFQDHEDKVHYPNEPSAEYSYDTGDDLALEKSRNNTEQPRSDGNYSKNDAYYFR